MDTTRQPMTIDSPIAWLHQFHLVRVLLKGPVGKPLYSYHVTSEEYLKLQDLLKQQSKNAFNPAYKKAWAACFCLYIAETFRRAYDAGEGGWAWARFERKIDCSFNPQQRGELVELGLVGYWKRPIRIRSTKKDLLGSLFLEGGLPWPLVQSDSHGFGRAVRRGMNYYYQAQSSGQTTASTIATCEEYLPQSFRNLETRQLLAGIVDQLMSIAEKYSQLNDKPDPAAYLDEHLPEWYLDFPIPLDNENARSLINDWLKDAGKRRQERQEAIENDQGFTCSHQLVGDLENWNIQTSVVLPKRANLTVDLSNLASTRFEVAYFEGEQLLARAGIVYGEIVGNELMVRFPNSVVRLIRRELSAVLSLRLLVNGISFYTKYFDESAVDHVESPLIFEQRIDEWWLAGTESCSVVGTLAKARLPKGMAVLKGDATEIATDSEGACWVQFSDVVQIGDNDNIFAIEFTQNANRLQIVLEGAYANYDSSPATIFKGWPKLNIPELHPLAKDLLIHSANSKSKEQTSFSQIFGIVNYHVKNSRGETILKRRFGLLPIGFEIALYPATANLPARLLVKGSKSATLKVTSQGCDVRQTENEKGTVFELLHSASAIPQLVSLQVSDQQNSEPVVISFPFPYQGARLLGSSKLQSGCHELTVDDLFGLQIMLTSGRQQVERFYVDMELTPSVAPKPKRSYVIDVGETPEVISLSSYMDDLVQMLAAVPRQDSFIQIIIQTNTRHMTLNVRRYAGRIVWNEPQSFVWLNMSKIAHYLALVRQQCCSVHQKRMRLNLRRENRKESTPGNSSWLMKCLGIRLG